MSREEYMKQLAFLLQDIPEDEKREALDWYEDYFDEAGPEIEEEIIRTLGSPEKVAAIIKDGLRGRDPEAGEYTESGYQDSRFREDDKVPGPVKVSLKKEKKGNYTYDESGVEPGRKRSRGEILLIIMICIVALPVLFGLLGSVFGIVGGALGVAVAIAVTIPVCLIAALIAGIVCIGVGIAQVFISPGAGLVCLGGGLLSLAGGILLLILCVQFFGRFVPWVVRRLTEICGRLFRREGRV